MKDGELLTLKTPSGAALRLELAMTEAKKTQGLQGRLTLPNQGGMLFVYSDAPQIRTMWMPNMKMALDIVWLDTDFRILHIVHNATPCKTIQDCPHISSVYRSQYAIEMAAGQASALRLQPGQILLPKI